MLGLMSLKKDYFYLAKWTSISDSSEYGFFRCKILVDGGVKRGISVNNIGGFEGDMILATKSALKFEVDDYVEFRGEKFNIVIVDSDLKTKGERALFRFKSNGDIETTLTLRLIV
jgi:hypothetical protein